MITPDMRAVIQSAHLCFAATVTPDGRPNLSPKGTIRVWDDTHLYFLDIASPGTRANLAHTSWMEINVVDQLSRRGYRFLGKASLHLPGAPVCDEAVRRITLEEQAHYDVFGTVLLEVARALPLVSPGYWHVTDERAMRSIWRDRRQALDDEMERYLATLDVPKSPSTPPAT